MDKGKAVAFLTSWGGLVSVPIIVLCGWAFFSMLAPSMDGHIQEIASRGFAFDDPSGERTLEDIAGLTRDLRWRSLGEPGELVSKGPSPLFLRVPYIPTEGREEFLVLPNRALRGISVRMPGGGITYEGGLDKAFEEQGRPLGSFFAFPIPQGLDPYEDILIRFDGDQVKMLSTFIVDRRGLVYLQRQYESRWIGVGGFGVILILSLFLAIHFLDASASWMTLLVAVKLASFFVMAFGVGESLSAEEHKLAMGIPVALDTIANVIGLMVFNAVFRGDIAPEILRRLKHFAMALPALLFLAVLLPANMALGALVLLDLMAVGLPGYLIWRHRGKISLVAPAFAIGMILPKVVHYVLWPAAFAGSIAQSAALNGVGTASMIGALYLHYTVASRLMERMDNRRRTLKSQVASLNKQEVFRAAAFSRVSQVIQHPLGAIVSHGEALLCGISSRLHGEARATVEIMVSEAKGLSQLTADLLELDALGQGSEERAPVGVDIRQLFREIERVNRPLVLEKGLRLTIDLGLQEVEALGDPMRLSQVLRLLVAEAINSMDRGTIKLSATVVSGTVRIRIQDSGAGLDPEALESLKDILERRIPIASILELPANQVSLHVAAELVRLQGGTLSVSSTKGRGSTFSLQLMASKSGAPSRSAPLSVAPTHPPRMVKPGGPQGRNYRVMVVDDDAIGRQLLRHQLKASGYDVIVAEDGAEALARVEEQAPDLILLDIILPEVSGLDVCRRLRERFGPDDLPIIFMTGKEEGADIVEGLQAGGNDYQIKPHSQQELLARIQTHIQLSKLTQAYSRFVPKQFLSLLHHESILEVSLGEQIQREMTVMFCDIRSFTTLSESMSPRENFNFLNSYLARVAPVIQSNGGFIDKYIGDGIMALFEESPEDALRAAIEIRGVIREYNVHRSRCGYRSIEIGIGLHTGNLMLGTIGYEDRMESTVISDAVNLSSRLESLTKQYGVMLMVSEEMIRATPIGGRPAHRYLGCVKVKGKSNSVSVFEIIEGDTPEQVAMRSAEIERFEQAVRSYEAGRFEEASALFHRILTLNPADIPTQIYLERCLHWSSIPEFTSPGEEISAETETLLEAIAF